MSQLSYRPPIPGPGFKPATGKIITAGVLLLVAAALCGAFAVLIPMATLMSPVRSPQQTSQVWINASLYGVLATLFGILGIGILIPRRWARPLILILCTHWLIAGILTLIGLVVTVPVLRDSFTLAGSGLPSTAVIIMLAGVIGFVLLGMVVWPALILQFTRGQDVRMTLEWRDSVTRWTDRCPTNILGLSLTVAVAAIFAAFACLRPVLPIMGIILHGPIVVLLSIVLAAALAVAAIQIYRLRMAGWWIALYCIVLPLLAYIPNGWMMSMSDYYTAAGLDRSQISMLLQHERALRATMTIIPLLFAAAFTIYMIRLRPAFIAAIQDRSPVYDRSRSADA